MTRTALNVQPAEPEDRWHDGSVEVVSVFYTIQGEGPLAGTPAVFVRLAGCNKHCPDCDTDYTSGRVRWMPKNLVDEVKLASEHGPGDSYCKRPAWVVLTGGEPLRQNVGPLVRELIDAGYKVQIETNGTLFLEDLPWGSPNVLVVCSPKGRTVHDQLKPYVQVLKYVVACDRVEMVGDGLPTEVLGVKLYPARPWPGFKGEVWVQPRDDQNDEANKANMDQAVRCCLTHGYRLGVQLHKIAGLD